jgi:cell pole-organizing protein PopZ
MQGREPSMEDILASIKRVIAEEKDLRAVLPEDSLRAADEAGEDILELDEPISPVPVEPPLVDDQVAGHGRQAFEHLQSVAASVPPPTNPLEDMIREMLRPMLKQWLDDHLPAMIDEHVKREISRITGRPL